MYIEMEALEAESKAQICILHWWIYENYLLNSITKAAKIHKRFIVVDDSFKWMATAFSPFNLKFNNEKKLAELSTSLSQALLFKNIYSNQIN